MKVSEFIEFLKTQDQEAIVQVIETHTSRSCGEPSTDVNTENFNIDEHVTIQDFTQNSQVKPSSVWYMKKYIVLGKLE